MSDVAAARPPVNTPTVWLPAAVAMAVAFVWRVALIHMHPTAYAFDGYQRWAGRDHILVQDWLPVTQALIWLTAQLGGDIYVGRLVMAFVAASAAGAGTWLAQSLAAERVGPREATTAGWAFVIAALFGPWSSWGTVFYQESTFLLVLFGGLALAVGRRPLLADLVIGLLGLVRYEGFPVVLMYIVWRRRPGALVSLWGMAAWLILRAAGVEGYHASPVSFADWEGLSERFTLGGWFDDVYMFAYRVSNSAGGVWVVAAAIYAWLDRRSPLALLIAAICASQIGITMVWVAGLEVSTSRMVVIPVVIAAVLGSALAPLVVRVRRLMYLLPVGLAVLLAIGLEDAQRRMRVENSRVRYERAALRLMAECPGCVWWVLPRSGLGTRARHDGCEIIQGISDLREGEDFHCAAWVDPDEAMELYSRCGGTLRWDSGHRLYVSERHIPGGLPVLPTEEPDPTLRTDLDGEDE
jgi:hypothetical protein